MKFLICPASQDMLDYGDVEDLFRNPATGTYFNYSVEFLEDEMVTITDSVGRYVPLDIEEVRDLAKMLTRIANFQEDKAYMENLLMSQLTHGAEQ
jgi:hypothetical protein